MSGSGAACDEGILGIRLGMSGKLWPHALGTIWVVIVHPESRDKHTPYRQNPISVYILYIVCVCV